MPCHTITPPADLIVVARIRTLLVRAAPALPVPTTTQWLAHALARVDGGPYVDPRRLGPALRACGFHPSFRRERRRRRWMWYPPPARPRLGRPPATAEF